MNHLSQSTPEQSSGLATPEALETLRLSPDMQFALESALSIGQDMVVGRQEGLEVEGKVDRTLVSNIDVRTNVWFNDRVAQVYGGRAEVRAEELSQPASVLGERGQPEFIWSLDSIDGTGEYVADQWDMRTGEPINPTRPLPDRARLRPIRDSERTSCTAIAMFKDGVLQLAAVYNPFRQQLVISDLDLGGSFLVDLGASMPPDGRLAVGGEIQARRLWLDDEAVASHPLLADDMRAPADAGLPEPPGDEYSAVQQTLGLLHIGKGRYGKRRGAIFAGSTLHDMAAPAKIIHGAGGVLLGARTGRPIGMEDFLDNYEGGLVYADAVGAAYYGHARSEGALDDLPLVDREGTPLIATFDTICRAIGRAVSAEQAVVYAQDFDDELVPDRLAVYPFGIAGPQMLSTSDVRRLRRDMRARLGLTRRTEPKWDYRVLTNPFTERLVGFAKVADPEREITLPPRSPEEPAVTIRSADLVLRALRAAVHDKILREAARHTGQ